MTRPSWDRYFMDIAELVKTRSVCLRNRVGALLVSDRHVLATGYNGPPRGLPHCDVTGCLRESMNVPSGERHELCRGLHAEQNAIIQAACHGVRVPEGACLYTTLFPCSLCAKMLINAGVTRVVYAEGYPDALAESLMDVAGMELVHLPPE